MRKSKKVIQSGARNWNGVAKDALVDGKIESSCLINAELSRFKIDTDVGQSKVMLAGDIAMDIDVVKMFDNCLKVARS